MEIIGTLIHRNIEGQTKYPTKIVMNNQTYATKSGIADQFNQYFVNVGPRLASAIEGHSEPLKYIKVLFCLRSLKHRSAIYCLN